MATIGPLALAAAALARFRGHRERRLPAAAVTLLILATLAGLTSRRCLEYRDAETLWKDTLRSNPKASVAYLNLASIHLDRGEHDQAVALMRQALLNLPDDPNIHGEMGKALLAGGQAAEAEAVLRQALAIDARWPLIACQPGHGIQDAGTATRSCRGAEAGIGDTACAAEPISSSSQHGRDSD